MLLTRPADLPPRLPWTATALFLLTVSPARAFDYFEHRWIGDVACGLSAAEATTCLLWQDAPGGVGSITFGDLTALVGDHYWTPEELERALVELGRRPRDTPACHSPGNESLRKLCTTLGYRELELAFVRSWLGDNAHRWSGDIEACAALTPWLDLARQGPWVRVSGARQTCGVELDDSVWAAHQGWPVRVAGDCFEPPESLVARLRSLPDRIALAAADGKHFGAFALTEWRRHHRAARAAMARGDDLEALVREAFAQHFLTDLFAAGHIRNPRGNGGHGFEEAMRYHDQDNALGLLVEPGSGGPRWYAYGDRCLFGAQARTNRGMVVEAARASFLDLAGREPWDFVPPRLSAWDTTPPPSMTGPAPLTLSLYTGAGLLVAPGDGAPVGIELVLAHDWELTTWWNPLLDLRHGVSFWSDGTTSIEVASAPLLEVITLPALPFVALWSTEAADAMRRVGKGIDPLAPLAFGPVNVQLDADVGLALVQRLPARPFRPHLLVRAGVFLEVPDRWRFYVPRVSLLHDPANDDGQSSWRATFTFGLEHAL